MWSPASTTTVRPNCPLSLTTRFDYLGGGAWHYDENLLADSKYRTWSQWRGYGTVTTTKGQAQDASGPPTVTQTLYARGMDGDTLPNKGIRSAPMPKSLGAQISDSKQLPGFTRESLTYLDGKVIAGTVNDPWISDPTGTNAAGIQSFLTGTATARSLTWLAASNQWRTTGKTTTFDGQGIASSVEDDGDLADPTQATCTRYFYARNTGAWMLNYAQQTQKISGTCVKSNQAGSTNIISDVTAAMTIRTTVSHPRLARSPRSTVWTAGPRAVRAIPDPDRRHQP